MVSIASNPLLVAEGLVKHYGKVRVLEDASVSVSAGESVAIVGSSGSGKTTLLSLLAGLERPDGGKLTFAGEDLSQANETALARWRSLNVGMVFQEYHLVPSLTALENVTLPLEIAGRDRAPTIRDKSKAMLAKVGLQDRGHHFPHQLSGGEQQRVALARALVAEPRLIFADEPTGNLDETTAAAVEDLLFDLIRQKGLAAVVVTHNPALASRCSRALHLHLGRFIR
jgi:putative ABC transport system ATP-binding protein